MCATSRSMRAGAPQQCALVAVDLLQCLPHGVLPGKQGPGSPHHPFQTLWGGERTILHAAAVSTPMHIPRPESTCKLHGHLRTQPSTARRARALGVPRRGITLQKGVALR